MKKVTSFEEFITVHSHFSEGLKILREILIKTELEEFIKWNSPIYELNGKKVLAFAAFKHHFGISFFNGVFLKDDQQLLLRKSETTKGLRHMEFKNASDIDKNVVLRYVKEAIENQKLGKTIYVA